MFSGNGNGVGNLCELIREIYRNVCIDLNWGCSLRHLHTVDASVSCEKIHERITCHFIDELRYEEVFCVRTSCRGGLLQLVRRSLRTCRTKIDMCIPSQRMLRYRTSSDSYNKVLDQQRKTIHTLPLFGGFPASPRNAIEENLFS